jgi:hypothetical protein
MNARTSIPGNAGHHAVHFYSDDARLCASVAEFLADGIAAGQPILIIATPGHRRQIATSLLKRRFDLDAVVAAGGITLLDAQDTLDRFMIDGAPDAARFRRVAGEAIARAGAGRPGDAVRAYGEMVDVLWRQGACEAAIQLELLWNELAKTHAFSLLCGYAMGSFFKAAARDEVLALHTHEHA